MTNDEILKKYEDDNINAIYGFMYGKAFLNVGGIHGSYWEKDKILEIPKKDLQLGKDKDCFIYIWGWPGPDANIYEFADYGKTWVFADKELKDE